MYTRVCKKLNVAFGKRVKQQELELGFLNAATASGEQELDSCTETFPLVFSFVIWHGWPFVSGQVFNQAVLWLQWEPVLTTLISEFELFCLRKALRPTKRRPSKGQQRHWLPRKLKLQVAAVGCVC